jgi:hypothetical protein
MSVQQSWESKTMAEKPSPKDNPVKAEGDPKPAAAKADGQPKAKPAAKADPKAKADLKVKAAPGAKAAAKPSEAQKEGAAKAEAKTSASKGAAQQVAPQFEEERSYFMRELLFQTPSWLVSMVFHIVLLLILALWVIPEPDRSQNRQLVVAPPQQEEDKLEELTEEPIQELDVDVPVDAVVVDPDINKIPEMPMSNDTESAAMSVDLSDFGLDKAPRNDLLATVGAYSGNALDGRGKGKGQLVASGGGTTASEKAVSMALKWLSEHQMPDGGWNFNHAMCPKCKGQCRNPGTDTEARAGATAMALLPFLGAGQTHKGKGKYKETVKNGLYFLVNSMKVSPQGGSLCEGGRGQMYSHGLASICLCEAYAMTHDKGLFNPAQQVVNFIVYAQDPVGGGWRYQPRQKGDTSVVGWQIMALKSGHMAYLRIPPITVKKAFQYLDTVQANSGANYGYVDPGVGQATSAIGLLCRMYLGWKKDNPALARGVQWISQQGPSGGNMYFNYYATQVMRHWEGEEWTKWNNVMREQLVKSQATQGHEEGSWHFNKGDHGADIGGRLYCTALATMILEVYYRHLPIYRTQSVEEDFPQ